MLLKARRVFRALENAGSQAEADRVLQSGAARQVAIDLIATENHIPRFLATRVYELLMRRLAENGQAPGRDTTTGTP